MTHAVRGAAVLLAAMALGPSAYAAASRTPVALSAASSPCTATETWNFSASIPDAFQDEYRLMMHTGTVARGFAEAMALRRLAQSNEAKRFAEYWASRALLKAALPHVAHSGFVAIVSAPRATDVAGVQLAALQCLNEIEGKWASVTSKPVADEALVELLALAVERGQKDVVWHYALKRFIADPRESRLVLLQGAGSKESLAQGIWAAKNSNHIETQRRLESFLSTNNPDKAGVKQAERYINHVHLLLARAYYSLGHHEKAFVQYKQVSRNSNELATALSELGWSALMAERYREAAGTAITLQVGGFRNAFAPEAPMVMAMALNELCQYPSSLQAIEAFKRYYEPSYKWLAQWSKDKPPLYPQAVDFLRKKSTVPVRVGTEWVRSPLFVATQEELNQLIDERDAAHATSKAAAQEQKGLGKDIKSLLAAVKGRAQNDRNSQRGHVADADAFTLTTKRMMDSLKEKITHYKRFRAAAAPWRGIINRHQAQSVSLRKELIARIESEMSERSRRMMSQLEEIAENNQLIEVEIYNSASQDIIWQNAHPDYKELARKLDSEGRRPASAAENWSWGSSGSGDQVEIWEDELGSFAANVFDNCSNKERFLAIRTKK